MGKKVLNSFQTIAYPHQYGMQKRVGAEFFIKGGFELCPAFDPPSTPGSLETAVSSRSTLESQISCK